MQMTGGEALAQQLVLEGVTSVFGVPGAQLDWATDGLAKVADRITFHNTRHEQATTYLADGYARASGQVGVAMVVPGPGLLNALAGLSTAWACSSPVLCISGQIPSHTIGLGLGMLHEIPDQSSTLGTLTKWQGMARTPGEVPGLVREAFVQLGTGRSRPVGLEIPPDVLQASADVTLVDPEPAYDGRRQPEASAIDQAADALRRSRRPVIVAGWGVQAANATEQLQRLAETLQAPVVMSLNGRGSLSDRHPLALTPTAGYELVRTADVVLAVGTRFMLFSGDPIQSRDDSTLIMVNVDEQDMTAPRPVDIVVVADAALALAQLADRLDGYRATDSAAPEVTILRERAAARAKAITPQAAYADSIRAELPDHGILVYELTQVGYYSNAAYPVYQPRTFLTPGYQGTLGYGFPTALGAKVARPDVPVVSITGDGGFGWNLQELATARRFDIGLVTVVFSDGQLTNVKRLQRSKFDGRVIGSDLSNPDFVALADSFGVTGRRADSPSSLAGVLRESLEADEPTVIEVAIGETTNPWPLLPTAPSHDRP